VNARVGDFLRLVRFEHTVFALPFALAGAWLAARGLPPWRDLAGLVLAAVFARSAAMAANRLADRDYDARNPRTADRELPAGRISVRAALVFTVANAVGFVLVAWWLAPVCGLLAPLVLVPLLGYSWLKRWTWAAHFGLGLALALAPAGAWLAVAKEFRPGWDEPLWLGLGVLAWVAGFDLLYALQDEEVDRRLGLHSVPARFGASAALRLSALCFGAALAAWAGFAVRVGLGAGWWAAWMAAAAVLTAEQLWVRRVGVGAVPRAFFDLNAWVGPLLFVGLLLDPGLRGGG